MGLSRRPEYIVVFLIMALVGYMLIATSAQSQAPETVTLTARYPSPLGEFCTLFCAEIKDFNDPNNFTLNPCAVGGTAATTRFNNLILHADNATTEGNVMMMDPLTAGGSSLIQGVALPQQWIDLNKTTFPSMSIYNLRTADQIGMGAADPPAGGGKTVYTILDIAEGMPVQDAEPGDVVCVSREQDFILVRSEQAYENRVAGIISPEPKLYMGPAEDRQPLALHGIVKCKAITENGPIQRGDLLVSSSTAGHAMRADSRGIGAGMLVGKALTPLDKESGMIYVLVNKQ